MTDTSRLVTIVVPALRETVHLSRLLESLSKDNAAHEIVIAVGPSSSATLEYARRYEGLLPIRIVAARIGAAAARNDGASGVQSEWILFLDADVEVPGAFVQKLQEAAILASADIATTRFVVAARSVVVRRGGNALWAYFHAFRLGTRPAMNGGCILVRASTFASLGGFCEAMKYGEDHELAARAVCQQYQFVSLEQPVYRVSGRRFDVAPALAIATMMPYVAAECRRLTGRL